MINNVSKLILVFVILLLMVIGVPFERQESLIDPNVDPTSFSGSSVQDNDQPSHKSPKRTLNPVVLNIAVILMKRVDRTAHPVSTITAFMDNIVAYWDQVTNSQVQITYTLPQTTWLTAPVDLCDAPCDPQFCEPCDLNEPTHVSLFINHAISATESLFTYVDTTSEPWKENYNMTLIWTNDDIGSKQYFYTEDKTEIMVTVENPDPVLYPIYPYIGIVSEEHFISGGTHEDEDPKVWGTTAHVIGHILGLEHTHGIGTNFRSRYELMANGRPTGLSMYSLEQGGWLGTGIQKTIEPGRTTPELTNLMPRSDAPSSGVYQSIKVEIGGTDQYYYVEVIQNQDELGDYYAPYEGVLIYRYDLNNREFGPLTDIDAADGSDVTTDQGMGGKEDILFSNVGRNVFIDDRGDVDTSNDIRIEITGPAGVDGYTIEVENALGSSPPLDPPDLAITPWGIGGVAFSYESVDIWIDNAANGFGVWSYSDLWGYGDMPIIGEVNRLYARVTNVGGAPITQNLKVHFWQRYLIAGAPEGPNGFSYMDVNDSVEPQYIEPGESVDVYLEWTPRIEDGGLWFDANAGEWHTPGGACVYVNVSQAVDSNGDPEEFNLDNNGGSRPWATDANQNYELPIELWTQENVHYAIPEGGAAPPTPLKSVSTSSGLPSDFLTLLAAYGTTLQELATNFSISQTALEEIIAPRTVHFDIGNPFSVSKTIFVNFIDPNHNWFVVNRTDSAIGNVYNLAPGTTKALNVTLMPFPVGVEFGQPLRAYVVVSHLHSDSMTLPTSHTKSKSTILFEEIVLETFGGITIAGRLAYRTQLEITEATILEPANNTIRVSGSLTSPDVAISSVFPLLDPGARNISLYFEREGHSYVEQIIIQVNLNGDFTYNYHILYDGVCIIYAVYVGSDLLLPAISSPLIEVTHVVPAAWDYVISIGAIPMLALVYITYKRKRDKK